jgi:hypothetical protein
VSWTGVSIPSCRAWRGSLSTGNFMVGAPLCRLAPARGNEQWAFFPKPRRSRPRPSPQAFVSIKTGGRHSRVPTHPVQPTGRRTRPLARSRPSPATQCCVGNTVRHHVCTNFEVMQRRASRPKQCKSSLYIRLAIYQSVPNRSVPSYSCRKEFFIDPSPAVASLASSSVRRFPCRKIGGRTRRPWQALALTLFRSARSGGTNKFC